MVFNACNTIFANVTGEKSLVTGLKETETTLGGSIWTANDNREKKIYGGRSMLFVKH